MQQVLVLIGLALVVVLGLNWGRITRLRAAISLFNADQIVQNFSHMDRAFPTAPLVTGPLVTGPLVTGPARPLPAAPQELVKSFTFGGAAQSVQGWLDDSQATAMVVLHSGALVHESYMRGTGPNDVHISWSVAKSFLSALFGVLHDEGVIADLNDPVTKFAPQLRGSAYQGVSIQNVLHMSSGVAFNEDYLDFWSDINKMGRVLALGRSMDGFAAGLTDRARPPGVARQYSSIDTHVLGMVMRGATGRSIIDLMGEKILSPIGLEGSAYYLTDGFGVAFVLGGLNMRTRDYARFGQVFADQGRLGARQLLSRDWVSASTANSAPADATGEARGYGYQWWLAPDAQPGEFFAIGIYGQYIYIDQMRNVVIALNAADRQFRDPQRNAILRNIAMFRAIARDLE